MPTEVYWPRAGSRRTNSKCGRYVITRVKKGHYNVSRIEEDGAHIWIAVQSTFRKAKRAAKEDKASYGQPK